MKCLCGKEFQVDESLTIDQDFHEKCQTIYTYVKPGCSVDDGGDVPVITNVEYSGSDYGYYIDDDNYGGKQFTETDWNRVLKMKAFL